MHRKSCKWKDIPKLDTFSSLTESLNILCRLKKKQKNKHSSLTNSYYYARPSHCFLVKKSYSDGDIYQSVRTHDKKLRSPYVWENSQPKHFNAGNCQKFMHNAAILAHAGHLSELCHMNH